MPEVLFSGGILFVRDRCWICSESSGSVPLLHGHREKAGKSHMSQLQIASYQSPWMRGKAGSEAPGKLLSTEEQPKEGRRE